MKRNVFTCTSAVLGVLYVLPAASARDISPAFSLWLRPRSEGTNEQL